MGKRIQIVRRHEKEIKAQSELYKLGQKIKTMFGYDYMDIPRLNPSPGELIRGSFGATGRLYEMKGGVALCYNHEYMEGCAWDVWLLGFNEENKTYQELKSQLEELASGNPDGIEKTMKTYHLDFSKQLDEDEHIQKYMQKLKTTESPVSE